MTRFLQGTTDHDGDGRMGGSKPGDDTMARKVTVKGATPGEQQSVDAIQSGHAHAPTTGPDMPEAKPTLPEKQDAAAEQFAKADANGQPELSPDEARMSVAVRGY